MRVADEGEAHVGVAFFAAGVEDAGGVAEEGFGGVVPAADDALAVGVDEGFGGVPADVGVEVGVVGHGGRGGMNCPGAGPGRLGLGCVVVVLCAAPRYVGCFLRRRGRLGGLFGAQEEDVVFEVDVLHEVFAQLA